MTYLAYVLISSLALVYASFAWKLYPHFISIRKRVVKSEAQLLWGRFAASWGVFAFIVLIIPLAWSDFDYQVSSLVDSIRHHNTEPMTNLSSSSEGGTSANSVKASKPPEQATTPSTSQTPEGIASSERSPTSAPQVASSEGIPQQPRESFSEPSAPGLRNSDSSGTFAPSFDCAKALTGPERLVCSNQQLASLDVQLMQAYRRAMSSVPNKESLKASQIDWRKSQRDACSTAECMISAYKARIQSLEAITP